MNVCIYAGLCLRTAVCVVRGRLSLGFPRHWTRRSPVRRGGTGGLGRVDGSVGGGCFAACTASPACVTCRRFCMCTFVCASTPARTHVHVHNTRTNHPHTSATHACHARARARTHTHTPGEAKVSAPIRVRVTSNLRPASPGRSSQKCTYYARALQRVHFRMSVVACEQTTAR